MAKGEPGNPGEDGARETARPEGGDKRGRILAQLRELGGSNDPEEAHSQADELLLELIDDPEIEEAFDAIRKWYA